MAFTQNRLNRLQKPRNAQMKTQLQTQRGISQAAINASPGGQIDTTTTPPPGDKGGALGILAQTAIDGQDNIFAQSRMKRLGTMGNAALKRRPLANKTGAVK